MTTTSPARGRLAAWLRLGAFVAVLLAAVLLPFALFGDVLDAAAPQWLQRGDARLALAAVGVALLVVDVVLPIPSSVVSIGLCLSLGPFWGGVAVALGCLAAFVAGYGLGRLLPEARLRAWIGPALWDRARLQMQERALWWIVAARPLPVLAEISALLAGAFRLRPCVWGIPAVGASLAVGALYAFSAWLGQREPGLAGLLAVVLVLPALLWFVHRIVLRRLLRQPAAQIPPSPLRRGATHEQV
ncbi:MAG: hypothetical protein BGP24_06205 [Lysobacterales bacterium 69-70]|nr:VTT domain-containing protein [Xanthomonadaceae bacterium]ODU34943.1 MAG: hypothetical protein ABS97_07185 [Xanthomonadaceae bacterium SCN 69-320]ODV20205.1 MAG: hypothetical protein ABT27_07905 [Xanthomonadaceae bacterium SCN 69-25]OJY95197.1 MAG: hypothetical protein BGP24_06205 [Xanthomonadales bacterium 69-70]